MNSSAARRGGNRGSASAGLACTLLLLAWPRLTSAQAEIHPYAASQYEYDSNIFDLSSSDQAVLLDGTTQRSDTTWRNVVGADAAYAWDHNNKLSGTAEARRLLYDTFSDLDHNEFFFSGALDWAASSIFDGKLSAQDERRMASFADRTSTQLAIEIDRNESASFNVNFDPDWRLETSAIGHQLHSPLPGFPDFKLTETDGNVGLKYRGIAKVTSGILLTYTDGRFSGVPDSSAYTQVTGAITGTYTVSGVTAIDGNIGYTYFRSRDPSGDNIGSLTGALGITQQLTYKTNAHLRAFRRVDSYVAGADALIDSGADTGLDWQATTKIGTSVDYQWIYSAYRALGVEAPAGSDRRDHYQATSLAVTYAALDWLTLRAYGNYYNRSSDIDVDTYNQAVVGAELRLRLP